MWRGSVIQAASSLPMRPPHVSVAAVSVRGGRTVSILGICCLAPWCSRLEEWTWTSGVPAVVAQPFARSAWCRIGTEHPFERVTPCALPLGKLEEELCAHIEPCPWRRPAASAGWICLDVCLNAPSCIVDQAFKMSSIQSFKRNVVMDLEVIKPAFAHGGRNLACLEDFACKVVGKAKLEDYPNLSVVQGIMLRAEGDIPSGWAVSCYMNGFQ